MSSTGQGGTPSRTATRATGPTMTAPRPTVGAQPVPRPAAKPQRAAARRVKLAVSRVDPWSVMKMSFLLAVAAGIVGVVVTMVIWLILSGMGVFAGVDSLIQSVLAGSTDTFHIMSYIGFGRVISLAIVFGVINIILLTALATLSAFLYNICAALVGGLQLTLTDD